MNWVRHLIILCSVLAGLFLFGHFLPKSLQISPDSLSIFKEAPKEATDSTKPPPTLRERVFSALKVTKESKRRNNKLPLWTLGKGQDLPVYLLKAQREIFSQKGQVIRMEELNSKQQSAKLSWADSLGDTTAVELTIGESFLSGSSSISVVFAVDSAIPIPVLNALNTLPIPYALLVQPFDTNQSLRYDIDKLKDKEIVEWIGMEPHQYPWINPGPNSILIHHNKKQITEIVEKAHKNLPTAIGIASRMGERAMEHRPLLEALLEAANKEDQWFMDLARSRFSKTTEVCEELGMSCVRSQILDSEKDPVDYWARSLNSAAKSGTALVILHLSESSVEATRNAIPNAEQQGSQIIKLSKYMTQLQ